MQVTFLVTSTLFIHFLIQVALFYDFKVMNLYTWFSKIVCAYKIKSYIFMNNMLGAALQWFVNH